MTIKQSTDKGHHYSFYISFSQKTGTTATMAVAAIPPLPGLLFFSLLRMIAAVI
jgi:hypothetical protein